MSLKVENGTGVAGAESYAAAATITAYWAARPHSPLATAWAKAEKPKQEGAAREATAYLDAVAGRFYKGRRKGYVQDLSWPRSGAHDEAGYPLPDLPSELVNACCELAARAVTEPLSADLDRGGDIKSLKAGSVEIVYVDGAPVQTTYGSVMQMLAPILTGLEPGAASAPKWNWL